MQKNVAFAHNFGGRSSATEYANIIITSKTGRVLHTVVEPSEFRLREDGTVTIYSRKHKSTSIYGVNMAHRIIMAVPRRDAALVHSLTF